MKSDHCKIISLSLQFIGNRHFKSDRIICLSHFGPLCALFLIYCDIGHGRGPDLLFFVSKYALQLLLFLS